MGIKFYGVNTENVRAGVSPTGPKFVGIAGQYYEEHGGYYAGANIVVDGEEYAVIVAPKSGGQSYVRWNRDRANAIGGRWTSNDGRQNTENILANSSTSDYPLVQFITGLRSRIFGGFNDWHVPSTDELEICYRFLKPNSTNNATSSSPNNNSNPIGVRYTSNNPSQTTTSMFIAGQSEAFNPSDYWTSRQDSAQYVRASCVNFNTGYQGLKERFESAYVRAVRWVEV